jgi:hypothetical protein
MGYSRLSILAIALIIEGGAAILALALARYFDIVLIPLSKNVAVDILLGTAAALPPFLFFMFSVSEKAEKLPLIGPLRHKVITDIKDIFDSMSMVDLAIISLLAGIGEEMLFRGVLQARFGILIASIVFGLMHSVSAAYVIVTIIMGLYIGIIFKSGESLLIPMQLHFIYDFAALVYLKYIVKKPCRSGQVQEK